MPRFEEFAAHARAVIDGILEAAEPGAAVRLCWPAALGGRRLHVLAFGKASVGMARAVAGITAHAPDNTTVARGLVLGVPEHVEDLHLEPSVWRVLAADHPKPGPRNVAAAMAAEAFVGEVPPEDTLLVLISGGGSAHLTLPAAGLTLNDLAACADDLMRAGAAIDELNTVRKHCERLKGGRLAAGCRAASRVAIIMSDVVGDRLDVIASGPTTADPTTYADALAVLRSRGLAAAHRAIVAHLEAGARGEREETLKHGDSRLVGVENIIAANHRLAVDAAADALEALGIDVTEKRYNIEGESAEVGRSIGAALAFYASRREQRPRAVVWGGETTVTVDGGGTTTGRSARPTGGPSQELALAAAARLSGLERVGLLAFSTDGRDGPTTAAGATVTGETWAAAESQGLHPGAALARHDSHGILGAMGALLTTGPTGTNVNHVMAGVVY